MHFKTLGFIMTDKCSASCKMCCFSCSPQKNTLLDKGLIKDYILQASKIGTFQSVAFTGGEAILYYDQLKECAEYAHSLGFCVTLITNGFWAADYEKGYKIISGLKTVGLTDVSISADQFHQEFVPVASVKNAIKICAGLDLLSSIGIMSLKDGESPFSLMRNLRPEIYGKDLIVYPVYPVGEASSNIPDGQFVRECDKNTARCEFDRTLTVMIDGTLMVCCSQFSSEIGITHVGRFGVTPLADAIKAFSKNDFLYVLIKNGFGCYVKMAEKLGFELDEKYCTPCHLCHTLFTNNKFVEAAVPFVKEEADRLRLKAVFK